MLRFTRFKCWNVLRSRRMSVQMASHSIAITPSPHPRLSSIPVQLFVDYNVRDFLGMSNNQRKTRIHLRSSSLKDITEDSVRNLIESKHMSLRDQPYNLRFQLMRDQRQILPKGNKQICAFLAAEAAANDSLRKENDRGQGQEQAQQQRKEEQHILRNDNVSLQLFVEPKPGLFPPLNAMDNNISSTSTNTIPHPCSYLLSMADPALSQNITMLSFYAFHHVHDPVVLQQEIQQMWKPFQAVGRVYVATEGVNGQLAVPSNVLSEFIQSCQLISLFKILPKPGLFLNVDREIDAASFEEDPAFRSLHIRIRTQILVDGLPQEKGQEQEQGQELDHESSSISSLDWAEAGKELTPQEWNNAMEDHSNHPKALILDCRNKYESDIGKFQGAIPLNTNFFRETFPILQAMLKDVDKNTPIITYCTGGIRCVKVNAYLQQRMGFSNTSRLKGGIVAYAREMSKESVKCDVRTQSGAQGQGTNINTSSSNCKFKGANYVFDERMSTRITKDVLSSCSTCGLPSDCITNCQSMQCHVRFIQCASCEVIYAGCCSTQCLGNVNDMKNMQKLKASVNAYIPSSLHKTIVNDTSNLSDVAVSASALISTSMSTAMAMTMADKDIAEINALTAYCEQFSDMEPPLLRKLSEETARVYAQRLGAARMISGHLQGRILSMLTSLSRATSVLELGSFTGYSALCFAEAIQKNASINIAQGKKAGVLTCEVDPEASAIAQKYFQIFNDNHNSIHTPTDLDHVDTTGGSNSGKVSGSAQNKNENKNNMSSIIDFRTPLKAKELISQARQEGWRFDVVFIDADKKAYEGYVRDLLGEVTEVGGEHGNGGDFCLLNDGALLLVDNTLWKGLVLKASSVNPSNLADIEEDHKQQQKLDRQLVLADVMHSFNKFVASHPRLTTVMLPIRDGLSCIRYSK